MYKRFEFGWLKHLDFLVADIFALQIAFFAAYFCEFGFKNPYQSEFYSMISILLLLLHGCVAFFEEAYNGIVKRGYLVEVKAAVKHVMLVMLLLQLYLYLTKRNEELSRTFFLYLVIFSVFFFWSLRCLLKYAIRTFRRKHPRNRYKLLVIEKSDKIMEALDNLRQTGRQVTGIVIADADKVGEQIEGIPVVAGLDTVLDYIRENIVDGLFVSLSVKDELPKSFLDTCLSMGVSTHIELYVVPEDSADQLVERIGRYTVLTSSVRFATIRQLVIKRCIDIFAGLVGLLIIGVCWLFIAPAIYIKSPGPIFFSQIRVGKNGRKFKIYKFRSMYMDAEKRKKELINQNRVADGMMFKVEDDPRIISGIGHFIREYSIDELPQLWNVLKGDMSLVGTRPPTVDEYEKYAHHHKIRLSIKPGITGMWQVSGRSNITDFEEVVRLDAKYITHWTLGLDLKILLKTVKVVLKREGAS